jgi:hypothetical protein
MPFDINNQINPIIPDNYNADKSIPQPNNPSVKPVSQELSLGDIFKQQALKLEQGQPNQLTPFSGQESSRYPIYNPSLDNEEIYGQAQPWYKQIGNSLVKTGGLAIGSFANAMLTIPDAIRASKGDNIYKNEASFEVDKWMQNLEDKFPNYYTKWEKEHPFMSAVTPSGMANFWGDKFLKNLGYTIGAIGGAAVQDALIGAVTEGIGEIPLISNQVSKAGLYLGKIFSKTDDVEQVLNLGKTVGATEKNFLTLNDLAASAGQVKITKPIQYGLSVYTSAHAEAGMEARQGYNDVKEKLTNQYIAEHGFNPTGEELTKIEDLATSSANIRYGANIALLSISNSLQFDSILKPFSALKNEIRSGKIKLSTAIDELGSIDNLKVVKPETLGAKVWDITKRSSGNIFTEGVFEEGGQYAVEKGTEDYFTKKYNSKQNLTVQDAINSTIEGLKQQFGTSEGLEQMLIGGLTGAITGPVISRIEKKMGKLSEDEVANKTINALSQNGIGAVFSNKLDATAQSLHNAQGLQEAVKNNNINEFKNFKSSEFFNFVKSGIDNNQFDLRIEQLKLLKELPQEELSKTFGLDKESAHSYIDMLINKAGEIKKTEDALSNLFQNPFSPKDNTENYSAFEEYKRALSFYSYMEKDYTSRENNISQELLSINPLLNNTAAQRISDTKSLRNISNEYKQKAIELQKGIDEKTIPNEQRVSTLREIQHLNNLSSNITTAISSNDENNLLKIASDVLNYEVSDRNLSNLQSIPREQIVSIVEKGADLNRIGRDKVIARDAYDNLFSEKGYEKFTSDYKKWKDSIYNVEAEPSEEVPTNEKEGIQVGRTYTGTLPGGEYKVMQEGNAFNLTYKGETVVTYDNQKDALAEADIRNEKLKNLGSVKVTSIEDNKVTVEDTEGNISTIDIADLSKYKAEKTKEELAAEEAIKLAKEREKTNKLKNSQKEISNKSGIPVEGDPEEVVPDVKPNEKTSEQYTYSSTLPTTAITSAATDSKKVLTNVPSHIRRYLHFASIAKNLPNRENLRQIRFTLNQEGLIGIDGAIEHIAGTFPREKWVSPEDGIIALVTVEDTKDGAYFIDQEGKRVGKVGEKTDPTLLVYGTMSSTFAIKNNPELQESFKKTREDIFNAKGVDKFQFNLSAGFAIPSAEVNGVRERVPASKSLASEKVINNNKVLFVPDGQIVHQGRTVSIPKGRTVFQWEDTNYILRNRKLTNREKDVLYKLILKLANSTSKDYNFDPSIMSYLSNILFWNDTPKTSVNQIYVNPETFELILGNKGEKVFFTEEGIKEGEEKIKSFLDAAYFQVNKYTLDNNFNDSFYEITDIDEKGNPQTKEWKNYQDFLLSDKGRAIDEIPLYTSVRAISDSVPNDYNFDQKYIILSNAEIVSPKKEEVIVEEAPIEEEKPLVGEGVFKFDDGIEFKYTIDDEGRAILDMEDPNYQENLKNTIQTMNLKKLPDGRFLMAAIKDQLGGGFSDVDSAIIYLESTITESLQPSQNDLGQTENKVTKTTKGKVKDNRDYSRVGSANVPRMSAAEYADLANFMKEKLPQIPMVELNELIDTTDGGKAWGMLSNGITYIFKNAKAGTGYHEAFEAVWKYFLTEAQKQEILNEQRVKSGLFKDYRGKTIEYSKATDAQLKEKLADDFADYRLKQLSATSLSEKVLRFFNKLINWFKSVFSKKSMTNSLFEKISKGGFKEAVLPLDLTALEYSAIPGYSQEDTHDLIQDVIVKLLTGIVDNPDKSIFNTEDILSEDTLNSIRDDYSSFDNDEWSEIMNRVKIYLKRFNIEFDEASTANINIENSNRNDYSPEAFTVDVKKSSPYAVKLILASLPKTDSKLGKNDLGLTKVFKNDTGMELVYLNKVFAVLYDKLNGIRDINDMSKRIQELASEDSDYERLASRLKIDLNTGAINESSLNSDSLRLLLQFYNVFSKQKPIAWTMLNMDGDIKINESDQNSAIKQKVREWLYAFKTSDFVLKENGLYKVSPKITSTAIPNNPAGAVQFLNKLGIDFPINVVYNLSDKEKTNLISLANRIKSYANTKDSFKNIRSWQTIGISEPVSEISKLLLKASAEGQEVTSLNVENKRIQNYTGGNRVSSFEFDFNSAETLDELKSLYPELNDSFATNSLILKKDGYFWDEDGNKKKGVNIKVSYAQGFDDNGKGTSTARLTRPNAKLEEINLNAQGTYYVLIPADSSTQWSIDLYDFVSLNSFANPQGAWSKIYTIFQDYLKDEITLAQEYSIRDNNKNVKSKAKELRFFKDILPEGLQTKLSDIILKGENPNDFITENTEEINSSVKFFIEEKVKKSREELTKLNQIRTVEDNVYSIPLLLDSIFNDSKGLVVKDKYNLSSKQVDNILTFSNVNYIIANIEMHKILFGDPYQFKIKDGKLDETKRIKSYLSPRQTTHQSTNVDNMLNNMYNKAGNVELSSNDPGYTQFKPNITTIVTTIANNSEDIFGSLALSGNENYSKVTEADGSSTIMLTAFRQAKIKNGQWDNKQAESWYQWEMAYTRSQLSKKGEYNYSSENLKETDKKTLSKPKPEYKLEVLKSLYTGPKFGKSYIDNVIDKMSQMPLIYSAVEGYPNLEKLFVKMFKEGIDYVIMPSGRKEGIEEENNLYNQDGSFNTNPFNNKVELQWKHWGIQVENSYSDKKQTEGSQSNKIVTIDLFDKGIPTDIKLSKSEWDSLSEDDKKKMSPHYKAVVRFETIKKEKIKNGYYSLLSKIGVIEVPGNFPGTTRYQVVDSEKLANALKSEMYKRDLSDNIIESININPETGDFVIPFEANSSYIKIRDIIWSFVDKSITSPSMSGKALVQVTSLLWEKNGRQAMYKKDDKWEKVTDYEALTDEEKKTVVLTSTDLKFYTKDEPWCEVYLPNWFADKLKKLDIFQDNTDEEIIEYLNKTEEGRSILTGIGFRIPTQGLNSMEVFKVKGFLAPEMGNTVVVPSEITTKAGSDFDIDKLNTYLKNVYVDPFTKDLKLVPYYGVGTEAKEKLREFLDGKFETDALAIRYILSVEKPASKEEADLEKLIDKLYNQSLDNEYIDAMQELLQLPGNFNRLIEPNTSTDLQELASEINKLEMKSEESIKNKLLDRSYMSNLRYAFLTAKKWVGIGAVGITGTSVFQKSSIYIDPSKTENLDSRQNHYIGNGIINLPHNTVTIGGKVYPSLSGVMDKAGKYISNKLSQYINAFVDVAKDPFITDVIYSDKVVSTFMFLERLGVPMSTVAFFMNQPIIKQYVEWVENNEKQILDFVKDEQEFSEGVMNFIEGNNFSGPDVKEPTKFDEGVLKGNILRYNNPKYKSTLDNNFKYQQRQMLKEFFKYFAMAEQLFDFTQAYTYDTTNFRSSDALLRKQLRTEVAKGNIISSIDNLMDSSYVGTDAEYLEKSDLALSEYFKFNSNRISAILDPIKKIYSEKFVKADKFQNIADKITTSFIDYLSQIGAGLSNEVSNLMSGRESVAKKVLQAKSLYPANYLLDLIKIHDTGVEGSAVGIVIKAGSDGYSQDLFTGYLRELRDDIRTFDLYNDIVKAAIIQGIYTSPISFANLIPLEDYAANLAQIMNQIDSIPNLEEFNSQAMFQRQKWRDDDIIPDYLPPYFPATETRGASIPVFTTKVITDENGNKRQVNDLSIIQLNKTYDAKFASKPVIKIRAWAKDKFTGKLKDILTNRSLSTEEIKKARKEGFSPTEYFYGYKKVYNTDGTPLITINYKGEEQFLYKAINLLGDGTSINEYSDIIKPSSFNNNTEKVVELSDEEVVNMIKSSDKYTMKPEIITLKDGKKYQRQTLNLPYLLRLGYTEAEALEILPEFTLKSEDEIKNLAPTQPIGEEVKPNIRPLITVESAKAKGTFRGKPLLFVDGINSPKDKPVAMLNDKGKIVIVESVMRSKFNEKAWTRPSTQKDGSTTTPISENQFSKFEEWFTFALLHESYHDSIKKESTETIGQYEDRINEAALNDLKKNYLGTIISVSGGPTIDITNQNNCG